MYTLSYIGGGKKSPLVHGKVMSIALMVVATKISLDLIKENLCSQHEQQWLPQMTRAREKEDEGCSLPKSAEKISCFIAGGGGLFCFFDI